MLSFTPPSPPLRRTLVAPASHDIETARQAEALACHVEALLETITSEMQPDNRTAVGSADDDSAKG